MKSEKKTIEKVELKNWNIIFISIVAAAFLGVMGVSYIRENSLLIFPVTECKVPINDFKEWTKAVQSGDEKSAILYASRIVTDDTPVLPNPDYIQLLLNNGLNTLVLTSPFNHFDYLRWKDAYEIKKITDRTKSKLTDPISELFHKVLTKKKYNATTNSMSLYEMFQVKISQYKSTPYVSIIDIWEKGYASMEELYRLLSAIAYQLNYDVAIIGIYDDSFQLIHALCEIRKNDKTYLCDPINRKIWKDMTVAKFADNPSLLKGIWSEKIIKALQQRVYRIPAESMDYKLYNQKLSDKLHKSGVINLPCFGESPQKRIEHYISKYENKTEKRRFIYWNFPFKLLMSSQSFPHEWLSPMLNRQTVKEDQNKITDSEEKSTEN